MLKKSVQAILSVALVLALCISTCSTAFAAGMSSKEYVKEVILSYGETADAAKKWLTDNGYQVVDNNLNEGADDTFSTKRAVYMGYKTTDKADEAITDMKLMNMNGSYSVQDYQMLLEEQKANIRNFFDNFKVAVNEYRTNYKAGQARAVAAHDMLNMLYDDDTQQNLGDLLLNKVREEYTDKAYEALTDEQKAKVADMTTILMQGNSNAITAMEQLIATATDDSDSLWTQRYQSAKTYDEMVEDLMDKDDLTVGEAQKQLAVQYDADAKLIAANFDNYKTYLQNYTDTDITIASSEADINAYADAHTDFDVSEWFALGTQYELLKALTNDDISLLDLITDEDYDPQNEDRTLLYPLVSVLTHGQRACLEFLPTYQLLSLGINDDAATTQGMKQITFTSDQKVSVYENVDRTLFGGDVALTGDAYRLQCASGKTPTESWTDYVSTSTVVLVGTLVCSAVITAASWTAHSHFTKLTESFANQAKAKIPTIEGYNKVVAKYQKQIDEYLTDAPEVAQRNIDAVKSKIGELTKDKEALLQSSKSNAGWAHAFKVASVVMTCITIALMIATLWSAISDLREFYNAKFTPIPSHMVDQGVNDQDETVFTYYTAVKCNRSAQNMVTDSTKLLADYGDVNGDVGRQWVALYTTKDAAAGDPITTDFTVQYNNTKLPDNTTPLSMFGESSAQNLTNKKAGYTYANSKDGIYLFYGTDSSALAGSVITNGSYVLVGGISALVGAALAVIVCKAADKKGKKKKEMANA